METLPPVPSETEQSTHVLATSCAALAWVGHRFFEGMRWFKGISAIGARLVGVTLLMAGAMKAWAPTGTVKSVDAVCASLGVVPVGVGVTQSLAGIEVFLGLLLLVFPGVWLCWCVVGLCAGFCVYISVLMFRGVNASCGCGLWLKVWGIDSRGLSLARAAAMLVVVWPSWWFGGSVFCRALSRARLGAWSRRLVGWRDDQSSSARA